jgi:hypothetical protein
VRRGLFASFLAGEREEARGAGLLDIAVGWCATSGFRDVVTEKSVFSAESRFSFGIVFG